MNETYSRELISRMLEESLHGSPRSYTRGSIQQQIALLREADETETSAKTVCRRIEMKKCLRNVKGASMSSTSIGNLQSLKYRLLKLVESHNIGDQLDGDFQIIDDVCALLHDKNVEFHALLVTLGNQDDQLSKLRLAANDKERLDWLESYEADLVCHRENVGCEEGEYSIWWNVIGELGSISGHPLGCPREALDAAMQRGSRK